MTKTDNELIAEFMGLKRREADVAYNKARYYSPDKDLRKLGKFEMYFDDEEHYKEWNNLMPVVKKIRVLMDDNSIYADSTARNCWEVIMLTFSVIEIEATYIPVVKFINWYNSNRP